MSGNTPIRRRRRPDAKRELAALLVQLDRRAADATLTILEIMADIDRRRASRLIEAIPVSWLAAHARRAA
jgi:hypothetical protein